MTEAEWLAWTRTRPMLRYLLGTNEPRVMDILAFPDCKGSDRKLRLFACACYHRISHLLPEPRARAAVELAEGFADGRATSRELQWALAGLVGALHALNRRWRESRGAERTALQPTYEALALGAQALWPLAPKAAYYASSNAYLAFAAITNPGAARSDSGYARARTAEERIQADLLRCIFGNLFRPVTIASAVVEWNDGTVRKLAQGIYDERAFDRLPVLADALEEAGCSNADVLQHCRQPGEHARGCWVVDLLLGRS